MRDLRTELFDGAGVLQTFEGPPITSEGVHETQGQDVSSPRGYPVEEGHCGACWLLAGCFVVVFCLGAASGFVSTLAYSIYRGWQ